MLVLFAAVALSSPAAAGARYGDSLLAHEIERHADLRSAAMDIAAPQPAHFQIGNARGRAEPVSLPLFDGVGEAIGHLTLQLARTNKAEAAQIASDIARHAYSPAVLSEPDPYSPGTLPSRVGQRLVERELANEPSLVTIAFHVALPGRANTIIASNFGRIGKAADADDQHVIADSAVLQEETNAGRRLAVELPLLDRHNRIIGALSTSFLIGAAGREEAYRSALRVQRRLARVIPSLGSLGG